MNTPTPRTDAATYPADCLGKTLVTNRDCSRALETELVTLTGTYTCTHHNDQMRTACPVCLAIALTAERDELRDEAASQRLHGGLIFRLTAERDQLRAENSTLRAAQKACEACDEPTAFEVRQLRDEMERTDAIYQRACEVEHQLRSDCENETKWAAHYLADAIASKARAERAEAAETVALANWNGALERAMKAEADLVALGQCHDDNCRAVVKFAAELAADRARLDWVFRNCKVEADDFTTGNRDVYAIHDREDLGAAMKEDAK